MGTKTTDPGDETTLFLPIHGWFIFTNPMDPRIRCSECTWGTIWGAICIFLGGTWTHRVTLNVDKTSIRIQYVVDPIR